MPIEVAWTPRDLPSSPGFPSLRWDTDEFSGQSGRRAEFGLHR